MRVSILTVMLLLGGCAADRDALRDRPADHWYVTAVRFDVYQSCMAWAQRRLGPMIVSNQGERRHLRFGDDLLLTLSSAPEQRTRVEVRTRKGYPPPLPAAVRMTTIRQVVESCL